MRQATKIAARKRQESDRATSRLPADTKVFARSSVSNGTSVLPGTDGRSLLARRYRDIAGALLADYGGLSECSESRQQLIRRFAASAVLAEMMEAKLANGQTIDIAEHALLCSTLVRLAQRLGLNRIARDAITPSLDEYLSQRNGNGGQPS